MFPPAYRPVTAHELAAMLDRVHSEAMSGDALAFADDPEFSRLLWLRDRYTKGGGGWAHHGCDCKVHPPHFKLSGRIVGGYSGLPNTVPEEGGLGFFAGTNVYFEPELTFTIGDFWAVADFRIGGRVGEGGVDFSDPGSHDDPLAWADWVRPTGRADERDLRLDAGAWRGQVTRALVGAQLGRWALSAGWDNRRTGPALTGDLNLDYRGRPFAAVTARRTESFKWRGVMTHLAPDQLLLRTGLLSSRRVAYTDEFGLQVKQANPWFMQWLVGWNVTPWFRAHFTHSVMSVAREGALWPDLLQLNLPVTGSTIREGESGPVSDRIFSAQFEFRWRQAPWPILPSNAGRLYWNYGGTDFLPSGPAGVVPEISIPASVVGFELLSPRWDLGFEYAELRHDKVLWYTNGGFREGYSHEQTLMGHPLGGAGESLMGLVRVRPAAWASQISFKGHHATWGMRNFTPGTGERNAFSLSWGRTPRDASELATSPLLWEITVEWNREEANRDAYKTTESPNARASRDWWRLIFKVGI
ncbi:MAG: hypothetical protein ACI9JE_001370 [Candidatus Krumholzibacteriia bacterium]|jgi:hypothetical protein